WALSGFASAIASVGQGRSQPYLGVAPPWRWHWLVVLLRLDPVLFLGVVIAGAALALRPGAADSLKPLWQHERDRFLTPRAFTLAALVSVALITALPTFSGMTRVLFLPLSFYYVLFAFVLPRSFTLRGSASRLSRRLSRLGVGAAAAAAVVALALASLDAHATRSPH